MSAPAKSLLRIGPFRLDSDEKALFRGEQPVPLTPKAFELLLFLIEHRGRLITKAELLAAVWSGTFVEEAVLTVNIHALRRALGDDRNPHEYIETVPRRGYRLIAPVTVEMRERRELVSAPVTAARVSRRRPAIALALTGLIVVLSVLLYRHWSQVPASRRAMLAVLPFENLSGDSSDEYLSDGFTEELITEIGKLDPARLGVIARTSVMKYKNTRADLRGIAREMAVDYVLAGSVRRQQNTIRVAAQLIRVSDQTHVWAESYERRRSDLLELQSEVARAVASEIHIRLGAGQQAAIGRRPKLNPEAHEAYMRGRLHLRKMTREGAEKAIEYFQRALAIEPRYAMAYAGIADANISVTTWYRAPLETMPRAREAALKALEIDPALAQGHALLGTVRLLFDWDWTQAEDDFHRAIELDPNLADGYVGYAALMLTLGRFDEAVRQLRLAQSLDPMSPSLHADELWMWFGSRQYDQAISESSRWLEVDANAERAYWTMALAYSHKGEHAAALAAAQRGAELSDSPLARVTLAEVYGRAGDSGHARQVLNGLESDLPDKYVCGYNMAAAYAAVGDTEKSFESLERAFLQRSD